MSPEEHEAIEDAVDREMSEYYEREEREAPFGRCAWTHNPALPSVQLLARWRLPMPAPRLLEVDGVLTLDGKTRPERKLEDVYADPSLPHERQGWLWEREENSAYYPQIISCLESWFAENIMAETQHINLLNMHSDVKCCERLPAEIKENLLLNIRLKLYEAA